MLSVHEQAALKSAFFQLCVGYDVLVVGALVISHLIPAFEAKMKLVFGLNLDDPEARWQ